MSPTPTFPDVSILKLGVLLLFVENTIASADLIAKSFAFPKLPAIPAA